jgi:hypothetical protein
LHIEIYICKYKYLQNCIELFSLDNLRVIFQTLFNPEAPSFDIFQDDIVSYLINRIFKITYSSNAGCLVILVFILGEFKSFWLLKKKPYYVLKISNKMKFPLQMYISLQLAGYNLAWRFSCFWKPDFENSYSVKLAIVLKNQSFTFSSIQ